MYGHTSRGSEQPDLEFLLVSPKAGRLMPAALIASAFLLSGFGCIMPIAWVTEIRALKLGVFVAWLPCSLSLIML